MLLRLSQAIIVALAGVALAAASARAAEPPYVPGEVLTKFKGQPGDREVELPPGVSVRQGVRNLRAKPNVAHANPNYLATASLWNPNDPGTQGPPLGWRLDQWNFLAPNSLDQGGAGIQGAWQNLRTAGKGGGQGVTVAVLDTGVAYRNAGTKYSRDPDLPPPTRFVSPKDFVDGDQLPLDRDGHGTHVASTIAQTTNNGQGLTGVAYGVNVMPIRVLNREELGTTANVATGIRYAVDHGADVINLSLEFKPVVRQCSQIPSVCAAVKMANNHGVVVVAAAGNQHKSAVAYPARAAGAIGIGATTYRGCLSSYSNYGKGLDMVAPGGGGDTTANTTNPNCNPGATPFAIRQYSLDPKAAAQGNYHKFGIVGLRGTSMAAAHVSGTAALLLAEHPGWTPAGVLARLATCARPEGDPTYYGAGLLDAAKATSSSVC
jgi:serine protease